MGEKSKEKKAKQFQAAQRVAGKLGVDVQRRHILLCFDKKRAKCASKKQMEQSWKYLCRRLKELKLSRRGGVLPIQSMCLDICHAGPLAVVYPEGTWYCGCTPEVLERILQEHVLEGRIVDEHALPSPPLCAASDARAKL